MRLRIPLVLVGLFFSSLGYAQPSPEPGAPNAEPPGPASDPPPLPPSDPPPLPPPEPPPSEPVYASPRPPPSELPPPEPTVSEGRLLASAYNAGFQWGISPGIVVSRGKAGFAVGLRFGYGIDTEPVIIVPGVRLSAYFMDPNVYIGMPTVKLVFPIDRFAPFIEGGVGVGHVAEPAKSGAAFLAGGGFMIYFRRVAFGAEASFQTIAGTKFQGLGVGPILALGF